MSEFSVSYDAMIRIARVKDRGEQASLLDAALKGAPAQEMRRRILERKEPARATERIVEHVGNYTASVQGPTSRGANNKMRAAVETLLKKLKLNHS